MLWKWKSGFLFRGNGSPRVWVGVHFHAEKQHKNSTFQQRVILHWTANCKKLRRFDFRFHRKGLDKCALKQDVYPFSLCEAISRLMRNWNQIRWTHISLLFLQNRYQFWCLPAVVRDNLHEGGYDAPDMELQHRHRFLYIKKWSIGMMQYAAVLSLGTVGGKGYTYEPEQAVLVLHSL